MWSNYIVDGIVALAFLLLVFISSKKGFITCFFGIVSTVTAFLAAIFLAKPLVSATGGLFGLEDFFTRKLQPFFEKFSNFGIDISAGSLAAMLIAGILLFIAAKLLVGFLKGIFNAAAEKITLVSSVNTLLGAVFGFLHALFLVSLVLAIATLLPIKAIPNYLDKTLFVGWLYDHNPLIYILSLFF